MKQRCVQNGQGAKGAHEAMLAMFHSLCVLAVIHLHSRWWASCSIQSNVSRTTPSTQEAGRVAAVADFASKHKDREEELEEDIRRLEVCQNGHGAKGAAHND